MESRFVEPTYDLCGGAQIRIRTAAGSEYLIEISISATVLELKQRISAQNRHPVSGLILHFGGEPLDDHQTLESAHVTESALLTLEFRSVEIDRTINFSVGLPSGRVIKLAAPSSAKALDVKRILNEKEPDLQLEALKLTWNQEPLDSIHTIGEIGLEGELLHAMTQVHGG